MKNNTSQNQSSEKDFSEKILKRIDQEKIAPRSRWYFVSHNMFVWATGVLALLLGAGVFAIVLFRIIHTDFYAYTFAGDTPLQSIMEWLPLFWFIFFGVFVYASYRYFQKTDHGYKYPVWVISLVVCAASIILGAFVFSVGVVPKIERALTVHVPGYYPFEKIRAERTVRPHKGHIAGEVLWTNSVDQLFALRDFTGKEWYITFEMLTPEERALLVPSTTIRVIGLPINRDMKMKDGVLHMQACSTMSFEKNIRYMQQDEFISLFKDGDDTHKEGERKVRRERISICRDMVSKKFLQKNSE